MEPVYAAKIASKTVASAAAIIGLRVTMVDLQVTIPFLDFTTTITDMAFPDLNQIIAVAATSVHERAALPR